MPIRHKIALPSPAPHGSLSLRGFPPFYEEFSVRRAVCWHAIGEELLEQIGIVLLGYIRVTPVKLLVSPVTPNNLQITTSGAYLTRLIRETCPDGRLSYSLKFTAAGRTFS